MAGDQQLQITVPDDVQQGVYANGALVWHSPFEFTIDFFATQRGDPEAPGTVPCLVTSRIKIPPTVIFDLLKALNDNMTRYERQFGEIRRPQALEPGAGPAEPA